LNPFFVLFSGGGFLLTINEILPNRSRAVNRETLTFPEKGTSCGVEVITTSWAKIACKPAS